MAFFKRDSKRMGDFTEQKTSVISQRTLSSIFRNDATSQRSNRCEEGRHKTDVARWSCFILLSSLLPPPSLKTSVPQVQEEDFSGRWDETGQGLRAA